MQTLDTLEPFVRTVIFDVIRLVNRAAHDPEQAQQALSAARDALAIPTEPSEADATSSLSLLRLDLATLNPRDRALAFAAAVWMTLTDGIRVREETEVLEALRHELKLEPGQARHLAQLARWIRTKPEPAPLSHELERLVEETLVRERAMRGREAA